MSINTEAQLQADIKSIQFIPIVPNLLNVVCRSTGMRFAAVARVTENRWITCLAQDEINFGLKPGDELKIETTICNEIRQSHKEVIIDDVDKDAVFCNHHTPAMYGFKSYISVPIFKKDGSFFGTLCAIDPKPAKLDIPEIRDMFKLFADLISFHLQTIEQLEESKLNLFKEREEKAKILEQKNAELQASYKELETFTYAASHDLQAPLRKIQTFSGRIMETETNTLSANGKSYFNRMLNSVSSMQTLIDDLLSYTRFNSAIREFKPADLTTILQEIKQDYAEKDARVIIEPGNVCTANIIASQIKQLFLNLINNSIKFSKPGVDPYIKISATIEYENEAINGLFPSKKYCHIIVCDNGIGFENTYSEEIFKIFKKLHGKQEYEGTGIGLAIVKKIVENHNGVIKAASTEGDGARFDIYLPQN